MLLLLLALGIFSSCEDLTESSLVGTWNIDQFIEIEGGDQEIWYDDGTVTLNSNGQGTIALTDTNPVTVSWSEENDIISFVEDGGSSYRFEITERSRNSMVWELLHTYGHSYRQIIHLSRL